MSEIANSDGTSESEKPVDGVQFPPFPDPKDDDFDDDISEEERTFYKTMFKDLNCIKAMKLHCTACDRHIGCSARNEARMRSHPLLRTLVCHNCHIFYNSGEFEKGDDGSELYCRWCGQGGQVYCCSDCPHVFCAKCIKRNMGALKIKEIENTDDWKCFKCNSRCLWDLRALCWAVLRYCDLKNKLAYQTQDLQLREAYKKDCTIDYSECCLFKNKTNRKSIKVEGAKKKEVKKETDANAKSTANIISKIPSTIQVKKFAAVSIDDSKSEKKPQKRSSSPKSKSSAFVKNPINIAPCTKVINPISVPPLAKKMKLPNPPMVNTLRFVSPNDRPKPVTTYARIRAKPPQLPQSIATSSFNGFSANLFNDNINLSLESLTQGLDMAAVAAISQNSQDDDVVCTPDFPLEPLCEVTEDNDDDVQCITPGPVIAPKFVNPPPLVPRSVNSLTADAGAENIIQMTENDVTVNAATGGLKFRVDPQTLSSNKMYRLPDGRIFAINANPSMPGGYSATIVAVTEPTGKTAPKGATYAAKLSAVATSSPAPTSTPKLNRNAPRILKRTTSKTAKPLKSTEAPQRECDLNVPVEWYRYNLIDAVDALEYALSRLHKLRKEATTVYLRTRSVNEIRNLHRTLERLLNTSSSRFGEIRDNLNKGLKQYVLRKSGSGNISEDDDDVEILPDMEDNDDPIFIDENSVESTINESENQEVDLTGPGSSEYNDSGDNTKENIISKSEIVPENEISELCDVTPVISHDNLMDTSEQKLGSENENLRNEIENNDTENDNNNKENGKQDSTKEKEAHNSPEQIGVSKDIKENGADINSKETESDNNVKDHDSEKQVKVHSDHIIKEIETDNDVKNKTNTNLHNNKTENHVKEKVVVTCDQLKSIKVSDELNKQSIETINNADKCKTEEEKKNMTQKDSKKKADSQYSDDKLQDSEMSEEMIETLLKDDNIGDEPASNPNSMDVSEILQQT